MLAADSGSAACVSMLLDVDGVDVNAQDAVGRHIDSAPYATALLLTCRNFVNLTTVVGAQAGHTALINAAAKGALECVLKLLQVEGIDVNIQNQVCSRVGCAGRILLEPHAHVPYTALCTPAPGRIHGSDARRKDIDGVCGHAIDC